MEAKKPTEPTFTTDRLRVFLLQCEPNQFFTEQDVFIAFKDEDGLPYPVCVCTINTPCGEHKPYHWVEWVETNSGHRRQGIARELLSGIVKHYGPTCDLQMDGATDEGDAFCEAWYAVPSPNEE